MRRVLESLSVGLVIVTVFVLALIWTGALQAQAVFDAGRVTVATTATAIYVTPPRGATVRICNRHTVSIFIGPVGVTTATGFEILTATCETVRAQRGATIYGIVAAATARVDYFAGSYDGP